MTEEQLQAIRERAKKATEGPWWALCYEESPFEIKSKDASVISVTLDHELDASRDNISFITKAREDVPALLAEVERLRSAIDNAADLLSGGESRLANRYLCGALGVDENYYGYFGEDDV